MNFVDNKLADIAMKLFEKNNKQWGETETVIMKMLKKTGAPNFTQYINNKKYTLASSLIDSNIPPAQIIKALQSDL